MRQPINTQQQLLELIQNNKSKINNFGANRLGLFGPFGRNQQTDSSDIDLPVAFQTGKKTFKNLVHLGYFSQDITNRKVQLVTCMGLADLVKKEVEKEIEYVTIAD